MTTDRKKPGVAFWATVGLVAVLLVGYPLSVGPANWLVNQSWCPAGAIDVYLAFYAPIFWLYDGGPKPVHDVMLRYFQFWVGL